MDNSPQERSETSNRRRRLAIGTGHIPLWNLSPLRGSSSRPPAVPSSPTHDELGRTELHWAAARGDANRVGELLHSPIVRLINAQDRDGMTALHEAVIRGHENVVCVLLENRGLGASEERAKIDMVDKNGRTALHWAADCQFLTVAKYLLDHAALEGDEFLDRILTQADTTCHDTALHRAALRDDYHLTMYFIEKKRALSGMQNKNGDTPLHLAAKIGPRPRTFNRLTPTALAALAKYTTNLDAKNNSGDTALHIVSRLGDAISLASLISQRAAMDIPDKAGKTAFGLASTWSEEEMTYLLFDQLVSDMPGEELEHRSQSMVKHWLEDKTRDQCPPAAETWLHDAGEGMLRWLAHKGCANATTMLLSKNVIDVNSKCICYSISALSVAARMKNHEVMQVLLEHPAIHADQRDTRERTPLFWAIKNKDDEAVTLLLSHIQVDRSYMNPDKLLNDDDIAYLTPFLNT